MTNSATTAPEAMKKLQNKVGGFDTYLDDAEQALLDAAVVPIPLAATITTAGPAAATAFTVNTPYELVEPSVILVELTIDGQPYSFGATGSGKAADMIAKACQSGERVLRQVDDSIRVFTTPIETIATTQVNITSRVNSTITITSVTIDDIVGALSPTATLDDPEATDLSPAQVTITGIWVEGSQIQYRFTSLELTSSTTGTYTVPTTQGADDTAAGLAADMSNQSAFVGTCTAVGGVVTIPPASATDTVTVELL